MQTQYLHDAVIIHMPREWQVLRQKGCNIHGNRTKKTCNGGHRTIKKGASTDPKKHFEVINFILGHFVNFLEEIYQEKFLDVSSPLRTYVARPCHVFTAFFKFEVPFLLKVVKKFGQIHGGSEAPVFKIQDFNDIYISVNSYF